MEMQGTIGLPQDAQRLVLRLLGQLARARHDSIDAAVDRALAELGAFAGADRAYIFEITPHGTLRNTYEWVNRGVTPQIDNLGDVPRSVIDSWMPSFAEGDPVHLPDVAALPATQDDLRAVLQDQGIRALLAAPFTEDGAVRGFIGFDNTRDATPFAPGTISLLQAAGDLVWSTLTRFRAETGLRDMHTRMCAMLEAMPLLMVEIDGARRFTGVAAGRVDRLPADPEACAGQRIADVLPADVVAAFEAGLAEAEAGRVSEPRRYRTGADGAETWHEAVFAPLPDAAGHGGALCVVQDVTEDEGVRKRLRRLGNVAEMMTNHVILTGRDGTIQWANRAFLDRSGHALNAIAGRRLAEVARSPQTDPAVASALDAAVADGLPFSGEVAFRTASGEDYRLDLNVSPANAPGDALPAMIHVGTDITRLRRAEREADEARRILQSAMDALPDAFAFFDAEDRLVICNQRYRDFYPRSAPMIRPGVRFEDLIRYGVKHGEYIEAVGREEAWIAERMAQHAQPRLPLEQAISDGRWLRVLEQATPDGGRVGMRTDITELKRAEERLANIISGAAVGTWEWNATAGTWSVNARFAHILGRPHTFFDGIDDDGIAALAADDDAGALCDQMAQVRAGGQGLLDHAFRMTRGDGSTVWVEARGRRMARTAPGEDEMLAGVLIDVSDRKTAEEALRRTNARLLEEMARRDAAEQRFRDIAAVSDDWFFELDADLRHVYLSDTFPKLAGRTPETMIGEPLRALAAIAAPDDRADWDALDATLAERRPVTDFIFARRTPDGAQGWLRLAAAPFFDTTTGACLGYRGVGSDVTALYAERLRALDASTAKSRLLATMSHEIRTPLNAILGMAELLEPSLRTARAREMLDAISGSGEMIVSMLNNLLDMAKIEAGQLELVRAPLAPRRIVEKTLRPYREQARSRSIDFELLVSPGADRGRLGDAHRIQQIVQNLVSNAFKFTSAGSITVRLSARAGKPVAIEVADTGIGMSETEARTVFDAFRQADSQIAERFGGTGLGLSIVRELVALMDGHIALDSAPGEGTRFRVTLPLPEVDLPEPSQAPVRRATEAAGTLHGRTLLVADDSGTNRAVLTGMLAKSGAIIHEAGDGEEAIALWSERAAATGGAPFDLIALDVAMPRRDGVSTLAELRALEQARGLPPTPALAVTANVLTDQVLDYIAGGFDAVLAKPFRRSELVSAISVLLDDGTDPAGAAPAARGRAASNAVLLADDDLASREVIEGFLDHVGRFETTAVGDGRAALAEALRRPFGLILLDRRMPGLSGDRVVRALRAGLSPNRDTAIVLVTGAIEAVREGRPQGGEPDLFIPKPIDFDSFTQAIRRLTGNT